MKIQVNKYKYIKEIVTSEEFELNEKETTYLKGRSGGDSYVAAIIPNYYISLPNERILNSFTFLSCNKEKEGRAVLSPKLMADLNYIESQIKHLPHYEDILNWFKGIGENYACQITDEKYFFSTINQFRVI